MGDGSPACLEGTSWENSHHLFPPLPKLGCATSPIIHPRLGIMGGGVQGRRWGGGVWQELEKGGAAQKGKRTAGMGGVSRRGGARWAEPRHAPPSAPDRLTSPRFLQGFASHDPG